MKGTSTTDEKIARVRGSREKSTNEGNDSEDDEEERLLPGEEVRGVTIPSSYPYRSLKKERKFMPSFWDPITPSSFLF